MKKIIVAGGCFWGVEHYYSLVKGIESTKCGYVNSLKENITYQETCSQKYKAIEAVELTYDESIISLDKILELLFRIIDPTITNRQGNDIGVQYQAGVYTNSLLEQEQVLNFIVKEQRNYSKPIVIENTFVLNFTDAEEYHQKYLYKKPMGYCHINMNVLKEEEKK